MRCFAGAVIVLSLALGFEESFEGIVFPVDDWTWANADSGERNWQRLDRDFRTAPGCAYCRRDSGGRRSFDWLITPQCTVSAGDSFSFWCRARDAAHRESIEVWVSTASPRHADFQLLSAFGTSSTSYEQHTCSLTPYAGQLVFLAIVYRSQNRSGVLVDDVLGPATWRPRSDVGVEGFVGELHRNHRYGDSLGGIIFRIHNWGGNAMNLTAWLTLYDSSGIALYRQSHIIVGLPGGGTVGLEPMWGLGPWWGTECVAGHADQRPWNDSSGRVVYRAYQPTPRGGPDSFGYYWYDSDDSAGPDFDWLELSQTGTRLGGGDDTVFQLNLPWPFRFYGQDYSAANVSTNGWLSFTAPPGPADSNAAIPSLTGPNCVVAPFWDDLLSRGDESGIWCQQFGESLFVFEWHDFGRNGSWRDSLNFEVKLFRSGAVEFHYNRVVVENGQFHLNRVEMCEGRFDQGQSATVGIESESGAVGLQYLHNGTPPGNYLQARRAIRFQSWPGGVEDVTSDQIRMTRSEASVVCGALSLQPGSRQHTAYRAELLDISGRRVMELHAGANDVSHLAPGVYFVQEVSRNRPAQSSQKVVIER